MIVINCYKMLQMVTSGIVNRVRIDCEQSMNFVNNANFGVDSTDFILYNMYCKQDVYAIGKQFRSTVKLKSRKEAPTMTTEIIISAPSYVPTYSNKMLATATEKVFKISETVRKCAFETAFIMAKVDAAECYKDDGFNSVHEWAMKTFGFKKSASYTLLRVGKEYTRAIIDEKGKVRGYGSNLILENSGTDFTTTQIEKMLPGGHDLAVELVESEEITPVMTCKEIEKVIKAHTAPEPEEPEQDETEPEQEGGGANEPEPEIVIVAVIDRDGNVTEPWYKIPVEVLEKYRI